MKRLALLLVIVLFLVSCQPSQEQVKEAVSQTLAAATQEAASGSINNPVITETHAPTRTRRPTNTPGPTKTPKPTLTPRPTLTSTQIPEPVVFTGTSEAVIDFDNKFGPAFAHITYNGGGNFAVWNLDIDNEKLNLLVNVIGSYDGYVPIDFLDEESTKRFQITSSGSWGITVFPLALEHLRFCEVPGICEGNGDDVRVFKGAHPDTAKVTFGGDSNFAIWSYGNSRDLLVNEIGNYSGTILFERDVTLIVVQSEGDWRLDITGR